MALDYDSINTKLNQIFDIINTLNDKINSNENTLNIIKNQLELVVKSIQTQNDPQSSNTLLSISNKNSVGQNFIKIPFTKRKFTMPNNIGSTRIKGHILQQDNNKNINLPVNNTSLPTINDEELTLLKNIVESDFNGINNTYSVNNELIMITNSKINYNANDSVKSNVISHKTASFNSQDVNNIIENKNSDNIIIKSNEKLIKKSELTELDELIEITKINIDLEDDNDVIM